MWASPDTLPALPQTIAQHWRTWRSALLAFGAGLLVLFAWFHNEAAAAVRVWNESTAYGHCYLVLPIAAFLAWERRAALAALMPRPLPVMAVLAAPAALAWFVAERLSIMEARQLIALGLVWLLALSVLGWRVCRVLAAPLCYLVFLVPFGGFLVAPLQQFTASFIDLGLTALDLPHVVTMTLIEIPEGNFRVAEACAGLRFLIAAIAFGALYACVIYRSVARRVAFIAVCVVVPVLANGIRALGIVLLGHARGSAAAGAVDHVIYGWLFFSMVILLLVMLGLPFRQDTARPARIAAAYARGAMAPAWSFASAAAIVATMAGIGPAGAAVLIGVSARQDLILSDEAARTAALLAIPAGCTSSNPAESPAGTLRLDCGRQTVSVQVRVFGALSGPAVLAAWRDATTWASEDDAETRWLDLANGRWLLVSTKEPDRGAVAALWLDGVPAPRGFALRLALALGTSHRLLLVAATTGGGEESLATLSALARAARR